MKKWTEIRRAVLRKGLSKRKACSQYGIHWETLNKILNIPQPPGYRRARAIRRPMLDAWSDRLQELYNEYTTQPKKQRYTAKRVYDILAADGFGGCYETIKKAWRKIKQDAPKEVFMPLTQPAGEAQVDFGYALAKIGGKLQKIAFFVMSLVNSDAMFVMAFPRECTESFLEAHVAAFKFFGFIPIRIIYDNTRVAVAQILGANERKLTVAFERIVSHYLFEPHFCRVRRPNEKGIVEGSVKYSRLNFMVPVPEFDDFAQLNCYLNQCCDSDMNRRLRGKTNTKRELLQEDKVAGFTLPQAKFDPCKLVPTSSSNESLVRFDTNDYSVPIEHASKEVNLKGTVDYVRLFFGEKLIASHKRCWDREHQIFEPIHYLPLLLRKPGSLDHARPLQNLKLPECFNELRRRLESQYEDGTMQYIRVLVLLKDIAVDWLAVAIRHALQWQRPNADAIKQLLIPQDKPELKTFSLAGREHLAGVTVKLTDISQYGKLTGEVCHG